MSPSLALAYVQRNWKSLAGVSWAASLALYLTLAPSRDQFNHAYMGWRLLNGDVLYRDIFDQNWPGIAGLHALAIWLFGVNLWSWRLFDFLLFSASALALADLLRCAIDDGARNFGLILIPPTYIGLSYGIAGQHDMSAAQFLTGAIWIYVRGQERSSNLWMMACGVLLGLAILNKPTVGIILVMLAPQALWFRQGLLHVVRQIFLIFAVTLIVVLAAFFIIVTSGATLQDIIDLLYTLSLTRRNEIDKTSIQLLLQVWSISYHPWWYALFIGSLPATIWFLRTRTRTPAGITLISLWLTGLLSYLIQGSGARYHLAPSYLAMAAASAASVYLIVAGMYTTGRISWQRRLDSALVMFVFAAIGARLLISFYTLPVAIYEDNMNRHWSRYRTAIPDVSVADMLKFLDRLPPISSSDCILAVGNDSTLNYLSRHAQPTRFYYFEVVATIRDGAPMAKRWFEYWEKDIHGRKCPLILISADIANDWLPQQNRAANSLRELLTSYHENQSLGAPHGLLVYTPR